MEDLISWLAGNSEAIYDVAFVARCVVLIVAVNFMSAVASALFSMGK